MDIMGLLNFGNSDDKTEDDAGQRQLRSLSRKLNALLRHAGARAGDDDEKTYPVFSPATRSALQNNRIIEAIKLYREETGVGLKEAKDAIDGHPLPNKDITLTDIERKVDFLMQSLNVPLLDDSAELSQGGDVRAVGGNFMEEVERLLRRGTKISAIALYREAKGVDLKEAKEAVDAIEQRLRQR